MSCAFPLSLPNKDPAVVPQSGFSEVNHIQSVSHPLPLLVRQAFQQCRRGKKRCRNKSNFRKTFCTSPVGFTAGVASISLWTTKTQDFLSSGVFAEQAQVRFTEGVGTSCIVCLLTGSLFSPLRILFLYSSSCHFLSPNTCLDLLPASLHDQIVSSLYKSTPRSREALGAEAESNRLTLALFPQISCFAETSLILAGQGNRVGTSINYAKNDHIRLESGVISTSLMPQQHCFYLLFRILPWLRWGMNSPFRGFAVWKQHGKE